MLNIAIQKALSNTVELLKDAELSHDYHAKVRDLQAKLANRELTIAVFGQFKRGKTTLINRVLGEDVLPVGIVPITSVVTKIRYGSRGSTVLFRTGKKEPISLESLSQYISEQENPDNIKAVSHVYLDYPCELLKPGLTLVDTPGVGSIHQHNTEAAYAFVKASDAVIFMLSVDSPINEIEREFLITTKQYAAKFYFAVNKIDLISPQELEDYLRYCEDVLTEIMELDSLILFPISAKESTGIDSLLADIQDDIKHSAEDILTDSVRIKFKEIVRAALSQVQLYVNALKMPLVNLEQSRTELAAKLEALDPISKDVFLHLEKETAELASRIQDCLEREADKIVSEMKEVIEDVYYNHKDSRPRLLEEKLKAVLETELGQRLHQLYQLSLSSLDSGYQEMTELLNKEIDEITAYLSELTSELFGIEYSYDKLDYSLSQRTDYYVRVNRVTGALFGSIRALIYLTPRNYANRVIYTRILNELQDDVAFNLNDIMYNCRYKLRESMRSFKSAYESESETLRTEIQNLLCRVIADRENEGFETDRKINKLDRITGALQEITAGL